MEGCGYRDLQGDFDALGVQIVGVSFDPPAVNQGWAEEEGFLFELWTDGPEHPLAVHYQAARATSTFPQRKTVVLDEDGVLQLEYEVTALGTHPGQVLEDCRILFGGR